METEVIVYEAAKGVATAVGAMVTSYRLGDGTFTMRRIAVRRSIDEFRGKSRSHAIGDVVRQNIKEIMDTQKLIDSLNPEDHALEMCMKQLESLSNALDEHLEEFKRTLR